MGLVLVIVGCFALFAGLIGLLAGRIWGAALDPGGRYQRWALALAGVAAPLMLVGLLVSDVRRIADSLGALLIAATLFAVIMALSWPVVSRTRGDGSTAWMTISGVLAALLIAFVLALAIVVGDLVSVLVLLGFAFVLLGMVAFVGGLVWVLVSLVRRRDRAAAGTWVWSAISVVVISLVGVAVMAPRPPSVPASMTNAADLDRFLEDLVESNSPPSVSVTVVADGETVYDKAFGVRDGVNGLAATPDTVYHWYSNTKIVTAIATMQLVERGVIDLDDPVSDHLSFFAPDYPSASSDPVTIADLLNHSSGIGQNVPEVLGWLHLEGEPALDQTEFLKDKLPSYDDLRFEPGSKGVYTNVGYYTLAGVIEQVTGESYEEYVIENVLGPLGMVNTRFRYTDAMVANEGVGAHPTADIQTAFLPLMSAPWPFDYVRDYDDGWIWFNRFLFDGNAPSGLIGPAPEMARLVQAILSDGELGGQRILSEKSVDILLNERHVEAGSSPESDEYGGYDEITHGIGWFVVRDGDRQFHDHTGGGPGFAALVRLYAEDNLGIVILANGTNMANLDIADAIAAIDWQ